MPPDALGGVSAGRRGSRPAIPRHGRREPRPMPRRRPGGRAPARPLGGLAAILGDRRQRQPHVRGRRAGRDPLPPAGPAGDRRRAHRPRVPAHRADSVQPLRQQRDVPGLRRGARRNRRAPRSGSGPRCGCLRPPAASPAVGGDGGAALRGRSDSPPDPDRDLQRHPQSPHGVHRHAVRPQRRVRGDLPGAGPQRAGPEPPRRAPRPAPPRSPGDQPSPARPAAAVTGPLSCRAGSARPLGRGPLRLPEGAGPQRARGVLDPVHDPRLVLPSHRGPQRAGDDGDGMRDARGSATSSGR